MKKSIKILLFLMCAMVCLLFASKVNASDTKTTEDGFEYYIDYEKVTITGINKDVTNLVIPNTIEGYPVDTIAEKAFMNKTSIEKVVIPENVQHINDDAFNGCTSLKNIEINSKDVFIANEVLKDTAIEELRLPSGVNGLPGSLFQNMNNLKKIYFEGKVTTWITEDYYDRKLTQESLDNLVKNTTIYGYLADEYDDDTSMTSSLTPKGFADKHGIKFVSLDGESITPITNPNKEFKGCYIKLEKNGANEKDYNIKIQLSTLGLKLASIIEENKTIDETNENYNDVKELIGNSDVLYFGFNILKPQGIKEMKLLLNDEINLLENNEEYNITFKNDDNTYDIFIKAISKHEVDGKTTYKLEKGIECLNTELKANYYQGSFSDSPYTTTITINPVNGPEKPKYAKGDVNKDGKINSLDAVEILKYVAKKKTLTDEQLALADTTRDGKVNSLDAVRILKYVAKKISEI